MSDSPLCCLSTSKHIRTAAALSICIAARCCRQGEKTTKHITAYHYHAQVSHEQCLSCCICPHHAAACFARLAMQLDPCWGCAGHPMAPGWQQQGAQARCSLRLCWRYAASRLLDTNQCGMCPGWPRNGCLVDAINPEAPTGQQAAIL